MLSQYAFPLPSMLSKCHARRFDQAPRARRMRTRRHTLRQLDDRHGALVCIYVATERPWEWPTAEPEDVTLREPCGGGDGEAMRGRTCSRVTSLVRQRIVARSTQAGASGGARSGGGASLLDHDPNPPPSLPSSSNRRTPSELSSELSIRVTSSSVCATEPITRASPSPSARLSMPAPRPSARDDARARARREAWRSASRLASRGARALRATAQRGGPPPPPPWPLPSPPTRRFLGRRQLGRPHRPGHTGSTTGDGGAGGAIGGGRAMRS